MLHLAWPNGLLSPDHDRLGGNRERFVLAERVGQSVREHGESAPVFTPTYQWTALLRFDHVDARQVPGLTRASHFTSADAVGPEHFPEVLVFAEGPLPPPLLCDFGPPQLVDQFPLVVRGRLLTTFQLMRYVKPSGPVADATPRPAAGG